MFAGIRSILNQGADPMKYAGSLADACGVSRAEVVAAIAEASLPCSFCDSSTCTETSGKPREVSVVLVADERRAADRRIPSDVRRDFDHEEE